MKNEDYNIKHPVVDKIRKIINDRGITQETAAEMMGTSSSQLSRILSGNVKLSLWQLSNFATNIGMEIQDVFTYPDKYVKKANTNAEPLETIIQIKLQGEQREKILKQLFGDKNIELLNK
ncbi:MAG: helix-turn-helix transcriptional regulator [Bacteroidaceae bacterium]|nr:helix-turn-helix transcriptional regulator [Bacteroidaceae bacterium]